jgi:GH35 family endo-1,4-beta-xylanase
MSNGILSIKAKSIKKAALIFFLLVTSLSKTSTASPTSIWTQNDWSGGSGQTSWSAANQFLSSNGTTTSATVQMNLNWYNTSWMYRKLITIDHRKVAATLINYPLLINMPSDSDLAFHAQANGNDILFTNSDGTTKLNHEIEKYTSGTGSLQAWVQIPLLSSTKDTTIYMYYGNGSATDQQNISGTWDGNYAAVWHLNEVGGSQKDSTSHTNNLNTISLTKQGSISGQIDGADQFNGSTNYLAAPHSSSLTLSHTLTLEAWINPAQTATTKGSSQTIMRNASSISPWQSFILNYSTPGNNICISWFNTVGTEFDYCGSTTLSINTWYHVVATYDGSTIHTYVNGVEDTAYGSGTPTGNILQSDSQFMISQNNRAHAFNGLIDEVRVSNIARSAAWVQTEYANQHSPATFYAVSSEVSKSSGTTTTLTSSIFDTGEASDFDTLTYIVAQPPNTAVAVYVRTGNSPILSDATAFSNCTAITSGSSMLGNNCVTNTKRYIQYQISLTSTDFVNTPTFSSISISFSPSISRNLKPFLGAALGTVGLNDTGTTNILKKYGFHILTPENELNMNVTQPTATTFDFDKAEPIIAFAKVNGMTLVGHILLWHQEVPTWVTSSGYTPDQLASIAQNRIRMLLQHYPGGQLPGQFYSWDVVNEALDDNQPPNTTVGSGYVLRPYDTTCGATTCINIWSKINQSSAVKSSGYADYVIWAFAQARTADPNHTTKLYYNDYNIEPWSWPKAKAAYNLVKTLHDKGLIDGVGLQTHIATDQISNVSSYAQDVETTIQQYQALGVDIAISEMDVKLTDARLTQKQADLYKAIATICAKYTACKRFTTWGVTDKITWIGTSSAPLLFSATYEPKFPAWNDVQTSLGYRNIP